MVIYIRTSKQHFSYLIAYSVGHLDRFLLFALDNSIRELLVDVKSYYPHNGTMPIIGTSKDYQN